MLNRVSMEHRGALILCTYIESTLTTGKICVQHDTCMQQLFLTIFFHSFLVHDEIRGFFVAIHRWANDAPINIGSFSLCNKTMHADAQLKGSELPQRVIPEF